MASPEAEATDSGKSGRTEPASEAPTSVPSGEVRGGSSESTDPGPEEAHRHLPGAERVHRSADALKRHYTDSSAEHLWTHLSAMDFINKGMLFAAVLLLCFFPFLIVANALAGRSAATGMVRRFGLNQEAANDVGRVFAPAHATSSSITGVGYVLFILGGIAAATAVQDLYERSFRLPSRGMKDLPRQAAWLVVVVGFGVVAGWVGPRIDDAGGPVLLVLVAFVGLVGFWWFTMWFLLGGRVRPREIVPSAVATAVCWIGMELVFRLTFSSSVISDYKKYGAIGVVFAFMSWLIAIGVVIILGAVVGVVWRERGLSFATAYRRLRRRSGPADPAV
jgi:membrane protein